MISMNKKYKTRDGSDTRILCVDAGTGKHPVIGLIEEKGTLGIRFFSKEGESISGSYLDLIEVKEKKIIRKWVNIYKSNHVTTHSAKEIANETAIDVGNNQIVACVPITIEFTEGEGL